MKWKRNRGFSLLEVIIALGLLAFGAVAIIGLFLNNARDAQKARDEVVLAILMRDIRTKCQLSTYMAFKTAPGGVVAPSGFVSTFDDNIWLMRGEDKDGAGAVADEPGGFALIDGGRSGTQPRTEDDEAFNQQKWEDDGEKLEDLFDANTGDLLSAVQYENLKSIRGRYNYLAGRQDHAWESNPLYNQFQFRLRTVLPPEWENNQYVDWDGYGWIGEKETGMDLNNDGNIDDFEKAFYSHNHNDQAFSIPFARPSHGVVYDPRGMRFYVKRLRCIIAYRMTDPKIKQAAPANPGDKPRGVFSGSYHEFTFSIYNPDTRKK